MPRSTLLQRLDDIQPIKVHGRVCRAVGLTIEGTGPVTSVGQSCQIISPTGACVEAEVVGFRDNRVLVMPLGEVRGIGPGSRVMYQSNDPRVPVGPELLGRILDGLGHPLDGKGPTGTRG